MNSYGAPVTVMRGRVPNPHVDYGENDIVTEPTTFPRYATPWNQMQLSNGWDGTNYGHRDSSPAAGYAVNSIPYIPGQTRLYGENPADFPMQGISPSQWNQYVQATAGSQPMYPGGPGQIVGGLYNPGSGA